VRGAIASGDLGYTKAREIVKVASPENETGWVAAARESSRRELEKKVAVAKGRARRKASPDQVELIPSDHSVSTPPASVPVRLSVEMTPAQFARYEALLEKLHRKGPVGGRAEMILDALAHLVEAREKAPRGAFGGRPPYQIHVHQCPDCHQVTTPTSKGELAVEKEVAEAMKCDAEVARPGRRNTATIPPATRRLVLARDRHTCRTPGCGHTRFLEVHHLKPRAQGGNNHAENLVTLCSTCHRLWHEKPRSMAGMAGG